MPNAFAPGSLRYGMLSLALVLLLFGCGGGGSDSGDTDPGPGHDENPPPTSSFAISGTVLAADGNAADSDVNEPTVAFSPNDNPNLAQLIPNPITLGGYLNEPNAGPPGRSRVVGDVVDWYRVSLAAGQNISLFIAGDGALNDLDLFLTDLNGVVLQGSAGVSQFETLVAADSGEFFVVVQVFSGSSNYILTVGQDTISEISGFTLNSDFVPGEVIVRFADQSATLQGKSLTGFTAAGGDEGRNRLFKLDPLQSQAALQALGVDSRTLSMQAADDTLQQKLNTLLAVKALARRADVIAAAPNYRRYPLFIPNDPLFPIQWHYPLINLPQAWDITTGSGAIVAVVDTGILVSHADLQGRLLPGFDFISDPLIAADGDGLDADANDPGDGGPGLPSSFHGTHVGGTVGAATNNQLGVAGVAFSSQIMPLRALGRGGGTDFDIEQAIRYAAGLPNDSGTLPTSKADVINLSLGTPVFSATSQAAFNEVRNAGVIVVAAAGNERSNQPLFPAAYDGVISVSAVDMNKELAPYSNFGSTVDVSAPGGNTGRDINGDGFPDGVLSTLGDDSSGSLEITFGFLQGTSMATPHVAGVIALMRSVHPGLTPQDVDNLLALGRITEDLGTPGRDDNFGFGLINALQAVTAANEAAGGAPIPPVPILSLAPNALNFGTSLSSLSLRASNSGDGALTVAAPQEDSGGWLTISATSVDGSGLGQYTVSTDRSGLVDGIYTANITFNSNANSVTVPVIMQVAPALTGISDIGQQFVIVFDIDANATVASVRADRQADGSYRYSFSDIPAGNYEIFSGTDSDNDFLICDAGEACGAYLTLDRPIQVLLDGEQTDIDFVSGFSSDILSNQTSAFSAGEQGIPLASGKQIGGAAP